jgi:hypothetical protein
MITAGCLGAAGGNRMWLLGSVLLFALGMLSLRGVRWAYFTFVLLGLLYFPARVGFRLDPHSLTSLP